MNKPLVAVVLFALIGAGLLVVLLTPKPEPVRPPSDLRAGEFRVVETEPSDPREPDPALKGLRLLDFEATTAAGETITEALAEGRYSVVAFIFTNCPFTCPMIEAALQATESEIELSGARFLLFSVDPEHDTPERLAAYAQEKGLSDRWVLATGPFEQTVRLVEKGFRLTLAPDDNLLIPLEDGTEMQNILHPSRLVLIGPDRSVLGFYDSTSGASAQALAERLDAIARLETEGEEG